MKKIYLSLLFILTFFTGFSQLTEDFEGAALPDASGNWALTSGSWKVFDNGSGPATNWTASPAVLAYNGVGRAADVARGFNGQGITSEDWLVMPRKLIRANEQLRFFTRQGLFGDTGTLYQIRVSTNADPLNQAAYTTIKSYTESELNEAPFFAFNEYNEKVINITNAGQQVFIAFVKVFTQPGAALSGDRWLVDDVQLALRCLEPNALNAIEKTCNSAKITWGNPGNAGSFNYEYGIAPFNQGSGTPGTTTTSFANLTGLQPGVEYAYYVQAVCGPGRTSEWSINPYTFRTLEEGSLCACPLSFNTLPYSDLSNTNVYGDNITQQSPGTTNCGTTGNYLAGQDAVYAYTATTSGLINISMNPFGVINTGVFVYNNCNTIGSSCAAGVANTNGNIRNINNFNVTAGQTIYIVISSTAATFNFEYLLTVQGVTCSPPINGTAIPSTTNALLSWQNPTGQNYTNWEYVVQPAGSQIPTGAGTATTSNSSVDTNPAFVLTPGTAYQYWVRADCGNGTFSAWAGPFLFNTTQCAPADRCNYVFTLTDSANDGWEGGRMIVRQDGFTIATLGATFTAGGTANITVPLCDDLPFELFWSVAGNSPAEIGVIIKNSFGQTLFTMPNNNAPNFGTVLFSGIAECDFPECQAVTGTFTATNVTAFGATLNWSVPTWAAGLGFTYDVYISAAPFTTPDNTISPTPDNITTFLVQNIMPGYVIPASLGLQQDTQYRYWVRINCSNNGPSNWNTNPNTFTTLPRCPRVTNLLVGTMTLDTSGAGATVVVPVSWTTPANPPNTSSWWVIAVPVTTPPTDTPVFDTATWIPVPGANASSYTFAGEEALLPETTYNYYVVSDCTPSLNGYSNVVGPKVFTTLPSCIKPTNLQVETPITPYTIKMYWTPPTPAPSGWKVIVKPIAYVGTPDMADPDWYTLPAGTMPYTPVTAYEYGINEPALMQNTIYKYWVKSVCGGVFGESAPAGPRGFLTLRSCILPSNLSVIQAGITPRNAQLYWSAGTQNGVTSTATSWYVKAVVATDPDPVFDAADTSWILVNTLPTAAAPFTFPGGTGPYPGGPLIPDTNYKYYVVGNCGATDGYSEVLPVKAFKTLPSCIKPAAINVVANSQTPFTINIWWTNGTASTPTAWDILYVPTGTVLNGTETPQETYTNATPPTLALPYTVGLAPNTPLLPDTTYDIYVRANCGTFDGVSTWTGPKTFITDPTCKKPTNLVWINDNSNPATMTWVEAATATQWEFFSQPYTGLVNPPTDGDSGALISSPTYSTTTGMTPGFYEGYVRAVCSDSDKSKWTGPVIFSIFANPVICAAINLDLSTGTNSVDVCEDDTCTDLTANFNDLGDTTNYNVLPIVFNPPFPVTGGTNLNISDDDLWSSAQTLPFNFCFFGNNSTQVWVGSNGVLTFTSPPGTFCPWNMDVNIPNTTTPILNAIYGVYQDIDPTVPTAPAPHFINFGVVGTAPCRAFVVNFYQIGQFGCGTGVGLQTSQIVLYETSNIIEVYVQNRTQCTTWNDGHGVIGIQNATGTQAFVPPGKNTLENWSVQNEAYRFTPAGASIVQFEWKDAAGAVIGTNTTFEVCPSETTVYTASATYTNCGVSPVTVTQNVTVNVSNVDVAPLTPITQCGPFTLQPLTVGNYFTEPNGAGTMKAAGDVITESTTLYVYATAGSGTATCSDEEMFEITIYSAPDAPTAVNQNECASNPIQTLTASATPPNGSTVVWYTDETGNTEVPNPTLNTVSSITYYAESVDSMTNCPSLTRTPVTLTIYELPAPTAVVTAPVCAEYPIIQTITAEATPPTGATVTWWNDPIAGNEVTPSINTVGPATFYAQSYDAVGGCTSITRTPVTIEILGLPNAPTSGGNIDVCAETPLQTITATATAPAGSTVVWFTDADGNTEVTNPVLNTVSTVSYYAESVDATTMCRSGERTMVTLTIRDLPTAPISGGIQSVCATIPTQTLTATATAPMDADVVWYTDASGMTVVPSPTLNTVGQVTYYAESVFTVAGCKSTTRTPVSLEIKAIPMAPIVTGSNLISECAMSPIQTLTAVVTVEPGNTVNWFSDANGTMPVSNPTLNTINEVTYWAQTINPTTFCESVQLTAVTLKLKIVPDFVITGDCKGSNYIIEVEKGNANSYNDQTATYEWKNSAGLVVGTNSSMLTVTQAGVYTCSITNNGCTITESFNANAISCSIQKGISPKGTGFGDGLNDSFDLEGLNVSQLEIFNRYGKKVYTKNNYVNEWFGQSDNGNELPDGTYYYVIKLVDEPTKTGWIYINREK